MAKQPLLSIIITSYTTKRLKDIFKLLDSIKSQTYPNIETVFVAEGSSELYERVKAHAEENGIHNMKVIFNGGERGLSASRNLGIKHAEGDIIGFVDDDTLLFSDWAQEMVKTYKDNSIIGVAGPALPLWEDNSMSWLPRELYWIVSCTDWCGWKRITEVRNAWGHNMSFKKDAFESCGLFLNQFGYHRGFIAEDNEFSMRVRLKTGKRIVYDPDVKVLHRVQRYRLSWRFIMERAYWIGRSRRMLRKFYDENYTDMDLFATERRLLNQILTRLLPDVLKDVLKCPVMAWHKLSITFMALFFVALGYLDINLIKF